MSAPLSGRESPPPETQSGSQGGDPPGKGHLNPTPVHARTPQPPSLESNPKHVLEDIQAKKYEKGPGRWFSIS